MIYIYHHLGLGDHIICNALVRLISKDNRNYGLFCKEHNIKNVSFMFRDVKNLNIIPIKNDSDVSSYNASEIIYVGHQHLNTVMSKNLCFWDEAFYKQFNIDFVQRWNSFYYERNVMNEKKLYDKLVTNNEKFVLIHNLDSTGTDRINYDFISKEYKQIFVDKNEPFFDYGFLIAMAKEIHCIDSSFKHLVDSIPTMGKLFYHKNYKPRSSSEHNHKKNWIII